MPHEVGFRTATESDLDAILLLLADDPLGKNRDSLAPEYRAAYAQALQAMQADKNQQVVLAVNEGDVIGCLQLTFIPGLTHRGAWRAQIEGVRVASNLRGHGIGTLLLKHAIVLAQQRGAKLVQLTSDVHRTDARRFYEALGFTASHIGFKLAL